MATLAKAKGRDLLENILPTFGNPRVHVPVWDESQKMFICDEYESMAGHRYFTGVRFADRLVIKESVGLYHSWTYIDGIEVYAFNGNKLELIQKRDYEREFRCEEFVRKQSEEMVCDYLRGALKAQRIPMRAEEVALEAKKLVDACYQSFLSSDYNARLTQILPVLLK